jgi:putative peptidoglycan lipid II flippase
VGGRFSAAECRQFATYFAIFCLSMFIWSAQGIYARAFYAAGMYYLPMIAGTIVTVVSLPIYAWLSHSYGGMGLAVASDIGIALQTAALAVLLHQRRMVSLASLDFAEIGRSLLAAIAAGAAVWLVFTVALDTAAHLLHMKMTGASRLRDLVILLLGSLLWIVVTKFVLERSGSVLPQVAMRRLRLTQAPRQA